MNCSKLAVIAVLPTFLFACASDDASYAQLTVPACKAVPAGLDVPLVELQGGALHWPLNEGPIGLVVDPGLEPLQPEIAAAVEAWTSIDCVSLEIANATFAPVAPLDPARSTATPFLEIQFSPTAGEPVTTTFFVDESAVLFAGHIATPETATDAELVRRVGQLLGLGAPDPGVASVMVEGTGLSSPTAADIASLCLLYGAEPLCAH